MSQRKDLIGTAGGISTVLHYDDAEDRLVIQNTADVSRLLDRNKELEADQDKGWTPGRQTRRVASIPLHVLLDLEKQGIASDPKRMKKWLNDPENRFFRTAPGRV